MLITVINVEGPTAVPGKKYQQLEINFRDSSGSVKGKRVVSFGESALVFNILKNAQQKDQYEITEDGGQYRNWIAAKKVEGNVASSASNAAPSTTQTFAASSNDRYETKEERQARQKYIIRQSSLSTAVETLAVGSKGVDPDKVVELARKYEAYVFETNPIQELVDMQDDLPD